MELWEVAAEELGVEEAARQLQIPAEELGRGRVDASFGRCAAVMRTRRLPRRLGTECDRGVGGFVDDADDQPFAERVEVAVDRADGWVGVDAAFQLLNRRPVHPGAGCHVRQAQPGCFTQRAQTLAARHLKLEVLALHHRLGAVPRLQQLPQRRSLPLKTLPHRRLVGLLSGSLVAFPELSSCHGSVLDFIGGDRSDCQGIVINMLEHNRQRASFGGLTEHDSFAARPARRLPAVRIQQHILDFLDRHTMLGNVLHVAKQVVFQIPDDYLDVHSTHRTRV